MTINLKKKALQKIHCMQEVGEPLMSHPCYEDPYINFQDLEESAPTFLGGAFKAFEKY